MRKLWQKLRYNTFGVRLGAALFIASAIPILLVIFVSMIFLSDSVTKTIRQQSEDEKQRITTIFNNRAYELERVGKVFARSSELYEALEAEDYANVDAYAQRAIGTLKEIDGAIVYNADNEAVATALLDGMNPALLVNPVMLERTVGSSVYSQELNYNYLANDGEHMYFVAIVQVQNNNPEEKKATGALVLIERLDQLFLQSIYNNFRYSVAFVDNSGDVAGTWQIKQFIKNNGITSEQLNGNQAIAVDGSDTLLIPVQKQVWAMISLAPITGVVSRISMVMQHVLVASLVMSVVVSFFLRIGITWPITQLVQRLQHMGRMNTIHKLPLKGPNELQAVALAFNDLIDSSNSYKEQSLRDGLTNSFNHRYLQVYLESLEHQNEQVTIFFGDIDYFKRINDTFGHSKGDEVICDVVRVFERVLGPNAIVSRYGGEEFVAIIPFVSQEKAVLLANQIRQNVMILKYAEIDYEITISIGVSDTDDQLPIRQLVKLADKAMYAAKQQGRNCVVSYQQSLEK